MCGHRAGGEPGGRNGCDQVEPLLEACYDGALSEADALSVRRHLRECERCSARLSAFGQIDRLLHEARHPVPPHELRTRLYARIASAQVNGQVPPPHHLGDTACTDPRALGVS